MSAYRIHFGTFYSRPLGGEDHDLYLDLDDDLDTLKFVVVITTDDATTPYSLDDYLERHPHRNIALVEAIRFRLS